MSVRLEFDASEAPGDPYASPGYGRAVADASGGRWCAVSAAGWRLPLILSGPDGAREATSPYGYAGFHIATDVGKRDASALWAETRAVLAAHDVVSLFLRFPPWAPEQAARASQLESLAVRITSQTVLVPTPSVEEVWNRMAGRARTAIRKAEREGLTATVEAADERISDSSSDFRQVYDATMERLNAPQHLRFSSGYYAALLHALGERLRVVRVQQSGRTVAACLLMSDGATLHYHLSGSRPEGARLGANNLMLWAALQFSVNEGLSAMHLGGGSRPDDSLFRFKASFGGESRPFFTGRAVINQERYDSLVAARAVELGVPPSALVDSDYFPAFRATPTF